MSNAPGLPFRTIMDNQLQDILKYRLTQADDSIREAEILLNSGGSLRGVVNRSYYGMFYSALALIASKGLGTSKHSFRAPSRLSPFSPSRLSPFSARKHENCQKILQAMCACMDENSQAEKSKR